MALKQFHPALVSWFKGQFGKPTEVQEKSWPEIKKKKNTLIAAPTGSGKTLAAFFSVIDDLVRRGLCGKLNGGTSVVYVSPLKALTNDIEKNLKAPLEGIKEELKKAGLPDVGIRVEVRTGDTPPQKRVSMTKNPPHILVTTPESLYLLITSLKGREMLKGVRTLIVDEIHAVVDDKRGSHLALSMERLTRLASKKLVRVGLSATQRPIETVARFLTGGGPCSIVDTGHKRDIELSVEVPESPLTAVMANEVWSEIYARLETLIYEHTTTLIFVNTRRLAERMTHNLAERLKNRGEGDLKPEEILAAHHGSISREMRLSAEQRLKSGELRAIIATASLELGIDIGAVDLVCQIGSPKSIATLLQRVGRSGHTVGGTPKGKIFPLTLDELIECASLLDAVRRGELDEVIIPEKPLDILAQHLVAEVSMEEYDEDELYSMAKGAYPYRNLERKEFDEVIDMLSKGFSLRKGRRGAHLHHDMVNGKLRARKGARLAAVLSGGAIPDNFDYEVVLEPTGTFIGTVNEDFAIESVPGDIFLLGNHSWRIARVIGGKVRVEDANGQPPTIPFWFGEAPGRTKEFSYAVSRLREEVSDRIAENEFKQIDINALENRGALAIGWLTDEVGLSHEAAKQIVFYLGMVKAALGVVPTQKNLVIERFFDEAGAMHLVIHSPFGSRLNRAWGLSLRKRFCRKFNFELQAAATEDSIILSLGATHSFPLDEVFMYLHPDTVRGILTQALLDVPMFEVRWRWNATRALAVARRRGNGKVPPAIQRIQSEDLIALVFPDQLACLENIAGDREIPDHPLVRQTLEDCLTEAMDIEELEGLLEGIHEGKHELKALDLREPSPLSAQILNARPYAFLDDAPLEERRTHAVQNRRWLDPAEASELSVLDEGAIRAVREEAWPEAENADELHDVLVLCGFLTEEEGTRWIEYFQDLCEERRATVVSIGKNHNIWVAAERLHHIEKIHKNAIRTPLIKLPQRLKDEELTTESAMVEVVRSRLEALGPVTAERLSDDLVVKARETEAALLALENEGFVFRGSFTSSAETEEWCERRLLARIHKYTLGKLRKEIEPVSAADYMCFLFSWHGMDSEQKPEGVEALRAVIHKLEGFSAQSASWEGDILPARVKNYDFMWLDMLCLSGGVVWWRINPPCESASGPIRTTPISIVTRENMNTVGKGGCGQINEKLSTSALEVFERLKESGATFFDNLLVETGLLKSKLEDAISELVAAGMVTSDSFAGLRALLVESKYKTNAKRVGRRKNWKATVFNMEGAGRWSIVGGNGTAEKEDRKDLESVARVLLRRYGVVFRKLLTREGSMPPWRELVRVFRLLELRGEVRGGRFVDGVSGEQFALPEAVTGLRAARRKKDANKYVSISAADPLNLIGIVTPGKKLSSHYKNRVLYKDGVPVAVRERGKTRVLENTDSAELAGMRRLLLKRDLPQRLKGYLGKGIS